MSGVRPITSQTNGCSKIFVICMHMICNQALSGRRRFERMDEQTNSVLGAWHEGKGRAFGRWP